MVIPAGWLRRLSYLLWDDADVIVKRFGAEAWAIETATRRILARSANHAKVIQDAVDYIGETGGGGVYIAPGTYNLGVIGKKGGMYKYDYAIHVKYDNTRIYGHEATLKIVEDNARIILGDEDGEYRGVTVAGLRVDAHGVDFIPHSGVILGFRLVNFKIIDNAVLNAARHGIHVMFESKYGWIERNYIENVGQQGVSLDGAQYTIVTANIINGATTGVNLQPNADIEPEGYTPEPIGNVISYNVINDVNFGVISSGGLQTSVIGNNITNNRTTNDAGIKFQHYYSTALSKYYPSRSFSIAGNVFYNIRLPILITGYSGYETEYGEVFANVAVKGPIGMGNVVLINNARYIHVHGNVARDPVVDVHIREGANANYNIIEQNNVTSVAISGESTYCDICVYESLPSTFVVKHKPIIYHDTANDVWYVAVWTGSTWLKAQIA